MRRVLFLIMTLFLSPSYAQTWFQIQVLKTIRAVRDRLFSLPTQWIGSVSPITLAHPICSGRTVVITEQNRVIQWHQIEGTYTAMGGEKYVTFGNFRSDNETMQKIIQTKCIRSDRSYILLDDVSVMAEQANQASVLSDKKEIQRITKSVFYAKSNEIELQLWDHNREDGDSVTILLNNEVIVQDIAIMKQLKTYKATLNKNINYIELQVINSG